MFSKKLFGQRLRECRKRAGETQGQLGELLGIHKSRISEMESGVNTTTTEKIAMICAHYQVSADYLLGLADEPEGPRARG